MKKRHYERPKSKVINLRTESYLLAGTNGGNGSAESPGDGGKVPTGAKKGELLWEEEYYQ